MVQLAAINSFRKCAFLHHVPRIARCPLGELHAVGCCGALTDRHLVIWVVVILNPVHDGIPAGSIISGQVGGVGINLVVAEQTQILRQQHP
ncbi:hypothetical protein D3C75_871760 [compost metagenome]